MPHEHAEENRLCPALAPTPGGPEATATMSRAHAETERRALTFEQLDDLRACLYGQHSVLRLHFTQEEENYFSLAP